MSTQATGTFSDSIGARIIALCLAGVFAIILYSNYGNDLKTAFSGGTERQLPVADASTSPEEASNPSLVACLEQRIGDVDRMKEEGILSESQYASFRTRAEELCIQQNPS